MNLTFDPREAARFLRTLRVATQTTIALDNLGRAGERAPRESAGAQEFRANRRSLLNRPDRLKVRKVGTGGSPKLEVFRNGFLGLRHRSFVMPNASALLFSESLIRAVGAFFGRKWRRGSGAPILLAIFDGKFCVLL